MAFGDRTWAQRRARRIGWLRFWVTAALTLMAVLPLWALWFGLGSAQLQKGISDKLAASGPVTFVTALVPAADGLIRLWPLATTALVSLFAAFWRSKAIAEKLHDRALGEFNDDLFGPIRQPKADGTFNWSLSGDALPYVSPEGGNRQQAHELLSKLVSEDVGDGRTFWPTAQPEIPKPLMWLLILGRPGSGKSRLVQEFARALGQRSLLGDPGRAVQARWLQAKAWLRRLLWFVKRAETDPWDAGKISGAPDAALLASWRPAKPTLLWLDDPTPGQSRQWLEALAAVRLNWIHPVRLVIVNQSIPADLKLQAQTDAQQRGWSFDMKHAPMVAQPKILGASARFTDGEVRQLLSAIKSSDRAEQARLNALYMTANLEQFLNATRGNPLLVELGLDWTRQGKALKDMSEDALLVERARRVLAALADAGVGEDAPENRLALACATLVGPKAPRGPIDQAFGALPTGASLRALVPADEDFDPARQLPCILPELVGDATVRAILAAYLPEQSAVSISTTGFRASPGGWLRAAERLGRRDDALGRAMRQMPEIAPEDGETRAAVAQIWITMVLHGHRTFLDVAPGLLALISSAEASLQHTLRDDIWAQFVVSVATDSAARAALWVENHAQPDAESEPEDALVDPFHRFMRGREILLIGSALRSVVKPAVVDDALLKVEPDHLLWLLREAGVRGLSGWSSADGWCLALGTGHLFTPVADGDAARIAMLMAFDKAIENIGAHGAKAVLRAGLAAALAAQTAPHHQARRWRLLAYADHASPDLCRSHAQRVEAITAQEAWLADRDMQLKRAQAWRIAAYADLASPNLCRRHVERVEAITAQEACLMDRDMQLERAQAWRYAAYADRASPVLCRSHAQRVEAITAQEAWLADRDMQLERARAWRNAAYADRSNGQAFAQHLRKLQDVVAPWGPQAQPPSRHDEEICRALEEALTYSPAHASAGPAVLPGGMAMPAAAAIRFDPDGLRLMHGAKPKDGT
jgi:hypothetical protein